MLLGVISHWLFAIWNCCKAAWLHSQRLHGCTAARLQGKTAWLQGCKAARLQGCKAAWLHGCKAARLQGCMAAWLHGCMAARLQGCKAARLSELILLQIAALLVQLSCNYYS